MYPHEILNYYYNKENVVVVFDDYQKGLTKVVIYYNNKTKSIAIGANSSPNLDLTNFKFIDISRDHNYPDLLEKIRDFSELVFFVFGVLGIIEMFKFSKRFFKRNVHF